MNIKLKNTGLKKTNSRSSLFNNSINNGSLRQLSDLKDLNTNNMNLIITPDKKTEINKNSNNLNNLNLSSSKNKENSIDNKLNKNDETNYMLTQSNFGGTNINKTNNNNDTNYMLTQSNFGGTTNKTNYLLTNSVFGNQSGLGSNLITQNDLFNSHNSAMFNNLGSDNIQTNNTNFTNNLNMNTHNKKNSLNLITENSTNNSFLKPNLLLDDKIIKEIEEELTKQSQHRHIHSGDFNLPDLINNSNLQISNFISEFDGAGDNDISGNIYDSKINPSNIDKNLPDYNKNFNVPDINMIDLKDLNFFLNVSTENSKLSLNKSQDRSFQTSSVFDTNILNHNIKNKVLDESFESNIKY